MGPPAGQPIFPPIHSPYGSGFVKTMCFNNFSSVLVLTFVPYRGGYFYECQNQRDTSNHMILVWL
jgi:hypothetical protein